MVSVLEQTLSTGHAKIGSRAKNIDKATSDPVFYFCALAPSLARPDLTRSHFTTETLAIRVNG